MLQGRYKREVAELQQQLSASLSARAATEAQGDSAQGQGDSVPGQGGLDRQSGEVDAVMAELDAKSRDCEVVAFLIVDT